MVASSITLTPNCPATPTSALSIAGRAGHAFTPQAMLQGFVCHARGVELPAAGPARVHARVRSKRMHDVHLRAEHGRLVVACSCPARSFGLDVCKHAWAALLEVDRQDALADLRKSRGLLVVEPAPPPPSPSPQVVTAAQVPDDARPAKDEPAPKPRTAETPSSKTSGAKAKTLGKTAPPPKKARPEKTSTPKDDKRETKKAAAKRPARASRDRAPKRR